MSPISELLNFLFQKDTLKLQRSRLFILSVIILGFTSCSEYLDGKPFRSNYIEIKTDAKLACLDNVATDLEKFLDSDVTDAKIDETVSCINKTLTEFQTKVEGRADATSFTSAEVFEILAKFASQAGVSQLAATNIILLKAAILGGDPAKITKSEINLLKNYLLLVKDEAKNLRPFIKLFYFAASEKAFTKSFIKDGFVQLNISLKNLYKSSQLANASYSFDNFKEFIINVLNLSEDKKAMADIASKLNTVLNGNVSVLSEEDRIAYIDNLTGVLNLYSLYMNGYVKFEISTSAEMNGTLDFIENIVGLIENSLQYKKTSVISAKSIDGLTTALTNSNFLKYKISSYDAAVFYRTLIVRVFESGVKGDIFGFTGLNSFHLSNFKREIGIYKVYSKMLERVAGEDLFALRGITSAPLKEIQQSIAVLNISDEQEILSRYSPQLQTQIINNVNDFRSEFIESNPVLFRNGKLGVAVNQDTWAQKWKDLARGLYVKMLTRLLMQGWGQIYPLENIRTNYLTEMDMTNWYAEFKHFGIAIKSFDPRTTNSGAAGFKTGNLFTRSGNGDNKLNFKELAENLGLLTSGSGSIYHEINEALTAAKCNLPELDVFENHWNYESCLFSILKNNYKLYFSSLPHLVAYLDTLPEDQFRGYFEAVLNVARVDDANKDLKIETADIRSMNALLYFIENVYVNHDTNGNWNLSEAEIKTAYPKFAGIATKFAYANSHTQIEDFTSWKGAVAGFSCFSEQDLIRESFVYLIYYGRTPGQSDFNSFPCFTNRPLLNFTGEVDRKKIINTFKALKSILGT